MSLIGETFLDYMKLVDDAVTSAIEEVEEKERKEEEDVVTNIGNKIMDYLCGLDETVTTKINSMHDDDYVSSLFEGDGEIGTTLEYMVEYDLKDVIYNIKAVLVPTIHNGYGMIIDTSDSNILSSDVVSKYYGMSFSDEVNQLIEKELDENTYEKELINSRYYLQDYVDTSSYDTSRE